MSEGWVCPKCGMVYSPEIKECYRCNNTILSPQPILVPVIPYYPKPYPFYPYPYPDPFYPPYVTICKYTATTTGKEPGNEL